MSVSDTSMPEPMEWAHNEVRLAGAQGGRPLMLTAGIGGVGCRVMAALVRAWPEQRHLLAAHTDARRLAEANTPQRVLLGNHLTGGFSTGGDIEAGSRAAEEESALLGEWLQGADLLLLCAGLGGGTGTGAAPVLARLAQQAGIPVLAFLTLPFVFEGADRRRRAQAGLETLRPFCSGMVVLDNRRLLDEASQGDASVADSFERSIQLMTRWIAALHTLFTEEGLMRLDFGDVRALLRGGGAGAMAYAEASGTAAALTAARQLLDDPLLERGALIERAGQGLLGLIAGPDLRLADMEAAFDALTSRAAPAAVWHTGVTLSAAWQGRAGLTVMTGSTPSPAATPLNAARETAPLSRGATPDKRRKRGEQTRLRLDTSGRGRFKDVDPTIYEGEDLDYPAFFRRNMRLTRDEDRA